MRIILEDYNYNVSLHIRENGPTIYVEYTLDSVPGFEFDPGFDIDEVEGLVDFMYSIIDKLDNIEPLESLGNYRRLNYMEWER
jgi:hypothetical protein|tara:strand:- start:62 stop:310 length:249 start_codon:yes stop_codon:yes gene_type:complete